MTTVAAEPYWQNIFQRLLGELDGRSSPDWQADEASLDPAIYLDDERFARE